MINYKLFLLFHHSQNAVNIVKHLQCLNGVHSSNCSEQVRQQIRTLDLAFKKRFLELTAQENDENALLLLKELNMSGETLQLLVARKKFVVAKTE